MNSGRGASAPASRRESRIGSIPDEARHPRGIFALPAQLVMPFGHQDRAVLLVTEPGALFANPQKGPAGFVVLEQLGGVGGERMRVTAELAPGEDNPIAIARHGSCGGGNAI